MLQKTKKIKIIVIGGPTASGKTDLAIQIAKEFNGELINADSRQVYKYLDIGTNKGNIMCTDRSRPVRTEYSIERIPIHLINLLNPDQQFNVFEYKKLAEEKIHEIISRGKLPILVGGTGLYIDAVIKNYELRMPNGELVTEERKELANKSIEELQRILQTTNHELLDNLNNSDRNNPRRLIRLIEKTHNGSPFDIRHLSLDIQYDTLFLYPEYNWEELKKKIEDRVEEMFEEPKNIVDEVKDVLNLGFSKDSVALQGIGYREVLDYLDGKIDLQTCINLVKASHKQYAKRQKTWFEGKGRNYNLIKVKDFNELKTDLEHFLK